MQNWFLPKITDYWDWTGESLQKFSLQITISTPEVRAASLSAIREAIAKHVRVLPDQTLLNVMYILADDLLKAGNRATVGNQGIEMYLQASAGTLFALAKQRKLILHYLVDNVYEPTEFGLRRPLGLYGDWFRAAGLVYICPQALAIQAMEHASELPTQYYELLPKYLPAAVHYANMIVERCHLEGWHYIFLNADSSPELYSFTSSMKVAGSTGIITALRTDAPVAGSKIQVIYPRDAAV